MTDDPTYTIDAPADPVRAWVARAAGLPPTDPAVDELLLHLPALLGILGRVLVADPPYGEATVKIAAGRVDGINYLISGRWRPAKPGPP
jgi:hypothetical protein